MTKARLMKEKEIADAENDTEKAEELEQRAEELDRRRTEKSSISSVSLINDRNRKRNVLKAEQAIQEEIKRKEIEGVEDNPFTRRKCNPRMVTKNTGGDNEAITSEMLARLAAEKLKEKENKDSAADKRKAEEEEKAAAAAKKPKLEKAKSKEDLFDAHNFDIEIDVGAALSGVGAGSSSSNGASASSAAMASAPKAGIMGGHRDASSAAGPTKRSLNLSDYKKKRGLI